MLSVFVLKQGMAVFLKRAIANKFKTFRVLRSFRYFLFKSSGSESEGLLFKKKKLLVSIVDC